jgi:hypothetical protein
MFLEFLTTWFQKNLMPARPPVRRRKSEFTRADLGYRVVTAQWLSASTVRLGRPPQLTPRRTW